MNGLSGHTRCTAFQHRAFPHHGAGGQRCKRQQRASSGCVYRQITCSGRQFGSQGGYGSSSQQGGDSRLIIPGRGSSGQENQPPAKLYTPDQQTGASGGRGAGLGAGLIGMEGKPMGNTFRPPPGFMDDAPQQDAAPSDNPLELLQRVRAGTGHWHELAKLLPVLNAAGFDGLMVEQEAGVERTTQNKWTVSMHVLDSLRRAAEFPKEKLAHFDSEGAEELLYEMRNLGVGLRAATAEYIADNDLDPFEATTLSRAVKEHERRGGQREGFSVAPGDCLAFKYYRDAIECRGEGATAAAVKKGLDVAVTPEAAQKLRRLIEAPEEDEDSTPATSAKLQTLRLTREEMGFKTVPLVSGLDAATAADLQALPEVRQSGSFSAFTLLSSNPKQQWVGLPAWNILLLARKPFAVALRDCSAIPAVLSSVNARTPEEKAKVAGPGLLVCDSQPEQVSEQHFYVMASDSGLQIVDGQHAKEAGGASAQVLFLCRPPAALGSSLASQTSQLLQV